MHATGMSPATPSRAGRLLDALLIGLPDAVTSGFCLWVWISPFAFVADAVKTVLLMLVMEFILLNATGLFSAIPFVIAMGRRTRRTLLFVLAAIYLLLAAMFAQPLDAVWPFVAFGWLALVKLVWIARNRRVSGDEQMWLKGTWAFSLAAYLGAIGAGVALAWPPLGITADIIPSLHLPGDGAWVHAPQEAVAAAVLYFAALALFKWLYVAIRKASPDRCRVSPI